MKEKWVFISLSTQTLQPSAGGASQGINNNNFGKPRKQKSAMLGKHNKQAAKPFSKLAPEPTQRSD